MPDESPVLAGGSAELLKMMMLAGAAVGIVSVFMLWFSLDYVLFEFDYTGYDFFMKTHEYPDAGYFIYSPLAVLAASAAAALSSVLSFTKHERKAAAAGIVSGCVIMASTLLYVLYPKSMIRISTADLSINVIDDMKLMDYLDAGVYSAAAAAMFLIVGGAVLILYRRGVFDISGTE